MFSDTDILDYVEASNPGLRVKVAEQMVAAGLSPVRECGLCHTPVDNGCEHVEPLPVAASMRRLVDRRCRQCGHKWTQPSRRGACPACTSRDVVNLAERQCGVMRA